MAEEGQKELYDSPEEEIRALEQKLEQKKREFASGGAEIPHEKEILREVLREHIEQARPQVPQESTAVPPAAATHILTDGLKKKADELKEKGKRAEQVRHLVEVALTRTIHEAVKVAESATPYLLDELHDHLVDDYYEKLVALRKIKAL